NRSTSLPVSATEGLRTQPPPRALASEDKAHPVVAGRVQPPPALERDSIAVSDLPAPPAPPSPETSVANAAAVASSTGEGGAAGAAKTAVPETANAQAATSPVTAAGALSAGAPSMLARGAALRQAAVSNPPNSSVRWRIGPGGAVQRS